VYTADIEDLYPKGVPIFANNVNDTEDSHYYFKYHHSAGDTMEIINPDDLDSNVVGIAALLYIIADLN
jgi:carboxypeptidase Q